MRIVLMSKFTRAALLVVDVQKAIDAAYHATEGPRNNVDAEKNIGRLLATWRRGNRPIIHIRHDSTFAASAYRPGQAGNDFKDEVAPAVGEIVIPKRTNSAFIGTGLERHLRERKLEMLVITGVSTNNSVEATVRMAGNLGFQTYLVEDACFTFARRDFHGRRRTADEVHSMSLANLHEEYCTVLDTATVLADE
jgi:nicotinamidase-related amidase